MKVIRWKNRNETGYMVRITQREAWMLVRSFADQVLLKSPNAGRLETYTVDGQYFSVAVHQDADVVAMLPEKVVKKARRKK